ncbi:MAG: hypothetical protein GQ574_21955 [Crocinitomix sp.]|nr:hypothetical protein [Crocinitomix sp.]
MRSKNLLCASIAFLVILIAAYFGATIHSSKSNDIISYLNEFEHINYYDVALIPKLNFQAALFSLPLLLIILVFEIIIALKSQIRQVKNLAMGAGLAIIIVIVFNILTLANPNDFDFSQWGYIWITMGAITVTANLVSVFVKGNA